MSFAAIPIRQNGQQVDATWWNLLRTAGVALEAIVGVSVMKTVTHAMSPYSVNPATDFDILIDSTAGDVAIVAPSAGAFPNYSFRVKNKVNTAHLGTVTFVDSCDGLASILLPFEASGEFKNDGVTYYAY